jgi:hypothetical protein
MNAQGRVPAGAARLEWPAPPPFSGPPRLGHDRLFGSWEPPDPAPSTRDLASQSPDAQILRRLDALRQQLEAAILWVLIASPRTVRRWWNHWVSALRELLIQVSLAWRLQERQALGLAGTASFGDQAETVGSVVCRGEIVLLRGEAAWAASGAVVFSNYLEKHLLLWVEELGELVAGAALPPASQEAA